MHGNFDHIMSSQGKTLTVCGPIFWKGNPPVGQVATTLTLLRVVVCALGRPPAFTTNPVVVQRQSGADEWMATLIGSKKWAAGPASAQAFVQLDIVGRQRQWIFETWSETIAIV